MSVCVTMEDVLTLAWIQVLLTVASADAVIDSAPMENHATVSS